MSLVACRKEPSGQSERVFRMRDVEKIYTMGEVMVYALRGLSIDIWAGEFTVLLGPSGSGKSTLLNILGGLDLPSSGSVYYRDRELTKASERERTLYRRDLVGFVFQFYNLLPSLTAWENVSLVTEVVRDPMSPEEALKLVGLEDRQNHFPSQLSGGEQQRVAIARAIVKRPEILLCDEPTGALDASTGMTVLEAVNRIHTELNTTTIVITHNAAIGDMADRVVTMRDGAISQDKNNTVKKPAAEIVW